MTGGWEKRLKFCSLIRINPTRKREQLLTYKRPNVGSCDTCCIPPPFLCVIYRNCHMFTHLKAAALYGNVPDGERFQTFFLF